MSNASSSSGSNAAAGFVLGGGNSRQDFKPVSVFAAGTTLAGRVEFDSPILVDCAVEGDLIGTAAIRIGPNGRVNGKVAGTLVVIDGKVKGRVEASEGLCLGSNAELHGEFFAKSLMVDEGAKIDGNCTMTFDSGGKDSRYSKAA